MYVREKINENRKDPGLGSSPAWEIFTKNNLHVNVIFSVLSIPENYQCKCVQDVDEGSQDLSVAVGGQESPDGSCDGRDGDCHGKVPPSLRFCSRVCHELTPAHA